MMIVMMIVIMMIIIASERFLYSLYLSKPSSDHDYDDDHLIEQLENIPQTMNLIN